MGGLYHVLSLLLLDFYGTFGEAYNLENILLMAEKLKLLAHEDLNVRFTSIPAKKQEDSILVPMCDKTITSEIENTTELYPLNIEYTTEKCVYSDKPPSGGQTSKRCPKEQCVDVATPVTIRRQAKENWVTLKEINVTRCECLSNKTILK